jgi:hypothetical protein
MPQIRTIPPSEATGKLKEVYESVKLLERRAYVEALEKWFNAAYLPPMKEKGLEGREKVKAIVGT